MFSSSRKLKMRRTKFTCKIHETNISTSGVKEIFGNLLPIRSCSSDRGRTRKQAGIPVSSRDSNKVQIGNKIYVFSKGDSYQLPTSESQKDAISVKSKWKRSSKIMVKESGTLSQKSSKTFGINVKCDGEVESETEYIEKNQPRRSEVSSLLKTREKSSNTVSEARQSFSPQNMLSKSVFDSILGFPLFNKPENKLFMPAEPKKTMVLASSLPVYKPSVLEVLATTRSAVSTENLARWQEDNIRKMGEERFKELSHDLKQEGIDLHNLIQEYLQNGDESLSIVSPAIEACWRSVKPVLKDIQMVQCMETKVVHPDLMYTGYVDCIATYKSKPVLIEWKKSLRRKNRLDFTYDNPLQVVAYMGAVNFDPAYSFQIKEGLLVFAYTDGSRAEVFSLSNQVAQNYWEEWLQRLRQYWEMKREETVQSNAIATRRVSKVSANHLQPHSTNKTVQNDLTVHKKDFFKTTEISEPRYWSQQQKPIEDKTTLVAIDNSLQEISRLNPESKVVVEFDKQSQQEEHNVPKAKMNYKNEHPQTTVISDAQYSDQKQKPIEGETTSGAINISLDRLKLESNQKSKIEASISRPQGKTQEKENNVLKTESKPTLLKGGFFQTIRKFWKS